MTQVQVKEYRLSFCTIYHRDDDIAVFEVDDGINIDATMVEEVEALAKASAADAVAILSNRKNSYSLSFEAMSAVANSPRLVALAIVVHSPKTRMLVEAQNQFIASLNSKPIEIFSDTESAISWLQQQLQEVRH
jgi:hypothetical protein